ncbi:MAG: YifB family Mg chelatase-like AAA ATPase [Bacillota bacterium]|nr:YifB family Mg chelatase-like AAA ATPase [Bacillota bacterium]
MVSWVKSCTLKGMDTEIIYTECDIGRGLPALNIVGLPDTAVRESKERLRAAVVNSGLVFPLSKRITVNLSPADTKKEGTHLDLAIALSLLACDCGKAAPHVREAVIVGELSLDGRVNPVKNILPITIGLRDKRIKSMVIPADNLDEVTIVEGIEYYPVHSLSEAFEFFIGEREIKPVRGEKPALEENPAEWEEDFSEVKGNTEAKRAVEISVSGFHHLLLTGPPGCGKSMLAGRIYTVMPELDYEEMLEVTRLYGISGDDSRRGRLMYRRPFRSPAANVSSSAMLGGGSGMPKPGEVTLAHRGVLFMDEMPEFRRDVLEALRQPLEEGHVSISRAAGKVTYPCRFILVGARNPCPCGYLNDPEHRCSCSPLQIKRYREKLSGPITDRIDLFVDFARVYSPDSGKYSLNSGGERSSFEMKQTIEAARIIQKKRYSGEKIMYNSQLKGKLLEKYCRLKGDAEDLYSEGCERLKISRRGADKVLRVARTIADMEQKENIEMHHMAEAFQFRSRNSEY